MKVRYRAVFCDVCGRNITDENIKYKFKRYESYSNYIGFEYSKRTKLDMCEDCYRKFCEFVNDR